MRTLVAFFVLIAMGSVALADDVFDASKRWWDALDVEARYEFQANLILTGHYDALVDGEFGPATFKALVEYQRSTGYKTLNGILSGTAQSELRAEGEEQFSVMGMALISDPATGVSAYIPRALLTKPTHESDGGVTYTSSDGELAFYLEGWPDQGTSLQQAEAAILSALPQAVITYKTVKADRVVVSGNNQGASFYTMLRADSGKIVGFTVFWTERYADAGFMTAMFAASYSGPTEQFEEATDPPDEGTSTAGASDEPLGERIGPFLLPAADSSVIMLVGDIENGATLQFLRAFKKRPQAQVIELVSNGGSVNEGLLVAHEVAERRLATHVPQGADCMSACAYIFFAGSPRTVDGELGVHQIYGDGVSASDAQVVLSDVLDALAEFHVPQDVISTMLRTPPQEMHVFSQAELASLEIRAKIDERLPQADSNETTNHAARPAATRVEKSKSLLLEASDDASSEVIPLSGTMEWSKGYDAKGQPTLVGRASIPTANLAVDLLIKKNMDSSLPASHVVYINFIVATGFAGGSIAGLSAVLPKEQELGRGDPLFGASARIGGNAFLLALSNIKAEREANLVLLRKPWLDIALIYASGKRAILTLEKDDAAQRIFEEAISTWGSRPYLVSGAARLTNDDLASAASKPSPLDLGL